MGNSKTRKPDDNVPKRHHYLPVFYLKQWAGADGKICRFSRPDGRNVIAKRVSPEYTAFVENLYAIAGYPPEQAQQIEEGFLRPIDSGAADALRILISGGEIYSSRLRSAWSQFLMSLLLRMPEDLEMFKNAYRTNLFGEDDERERRYQEIRGEDSPPTFMGYVRSRPEHEHGWAEMRIFANLLNHHGVGETIANMRWKVLDVSNHKRQLLTSDRPIMLANGIKKPDGYIVLPIAPYRLFLAYSGRVGFDIICSRKPTHLVADCNYTNVGRASKLVFGSSDAQLGFVRSHLNTTPTPSLMSQIVGRKRIPASVRI